MRSTRPPASWDHHQYHWNGSWDWDEANAPLLVDIERGGRTIPALVHPGRNGYLWLLDRSDGGMRFLEAQPFVHQNVFTSVDPFTGRPEYDSARRPGIGKRVEFCPSYAGGRNWRPEAFSPQTGLLYVPAINNLCSTMEGRAVEYEAGRPFIGASVDVFKRDGAEHEGELQAWNLDSGERVWTHELPTRLDSVLATAGKLVFADSGGILRAFDALSGELLWRHTMEGYGSRGVPMSYAVDGVQYIAQQFRPGRRRLRPPATWSWRSGSIASADAPAVARRDRGGVVAAVAMRGPDQKPTEAPIQPPPRSGFRSRFRAGESGQNRPMSAPAASRPTPP